MGTISLNGTAFTGLPNGSGAAAAWQPTGYKEIPSKIGATLVAANGTRNRVERGVTKRAWELEWKCNHATMLALKTIALLNTTFTFVDFEGTSYTVQTEDDGEFQWVRNSPTESYWAVKLKLYEG